MKGRKFVLVIKNQMVQVSLKNQIAELPERLQKEWSSICYSSKTDIHVFEEFKTRWEQFQGTTIEEFLNVSNSVYIQWKDWISRLDTARKTDWATTFPELEWHLDKHY